MASIVNPASSSRWSSWSEGDTSRGLSSIAGTTQNRVEFERDRNGSPILLLCNCNHSFLLLFFSAVNLLSQKNRLTKTPSLPNVFQKYQIISRFSLISFFSQLFLTQTLRFDSEDGNGNDSDLQSDSKGKNSSIVPLFHNHTLSKVIPFFIHLSQFQNW